MEKKSKHEAIAELLMPRKRKVPSGYDSNGNEYFHSNPKLFYFDVDANIILMLLTTLLEILNNDLINPIIGFISNCKILS